MATIAVWLKIDEERVVQALQEAGEKLDSAEGKWFWISLPCAGSIPAAHWVWKSSQALPTTKTVKVVLRGVNVDVYKVLKLVKLASRFSFGTESAIGNG